MENANSIDNVLLNQICQILDGVTTPYNTLLMNIFKQFEEIQSSHPRFCFYLLYIISSNQFPPNRRFCALVVLNRNFIHMQTDLIPEFISIAKPLMEQIMRLPFSPFTSISASILCSMKKIYGKDFGTFFTDFYEQILVLFTNQDTVQIGLQCIKEMVQNDQNVPDSLLSILPNLINSPFCQKSLEVSYFLCASNKEFIFELIIPSIFAFYSNFDEDSLSLAFNICSYIYLYYPNEILANFIISGLRTGTQKIVDDILEGLYQIPFKEIYPPLIETLLNFLEFPDQDVTEFGPCSKSQEILQSNSAHFGEPFNEIVRNFIICHFPYLSERFQRFTTENNRNFSFDESMNLGFFLRCIYTIIETMENNDDESANLINFYYTVSMTLIESPFRGDASLCLMKFCLRETLNSQIVNSSFEKVLSLLTDPDPGVRFQCQISLESIVESGSLSAETAKFAFLIDFMTSTNDPAIAYLAYRYAKHFPVLNDSNEYVVHLYRNLVEFFVSTTSQINTSSFGQFNPTENGGNSKFSFVSLSSPIFQPLVDLLSLSIKIVREPLQLLDKRIFVAALFAISNDAFDCSTYLTYFRLINSLLKTYMKHMIESIIGGTAELDFLSIFTGITRRVMFVLANEDTNLDLIKKGYHIISTLVDEIESIKIQLINDQSEEFNFLINKFIDFSLQHFTLDRYDDFEFDENDPEQINEIARTHVMICISITEVIGNLAPRLRFDAASAFLQKSYNILLKYVAPSGKEEEIICDPVISEIVNSVKLLGLQILELFKSNNAPIDENICKFFMA